MGLSVAKQHSVALRSSGCRVQGYRTKEDENEGFRERDKSVGFFMLSYSSTRFNVSASVKGCGFTNGIPPFSVGNSRQK